MACDSLYDASQHIEKLLVAEDGNRDISGGVATLYTKDCNGQLYDCASSLLDKKCSTIVLLVGSTSNMIMWPPTDTDGPGGCFALAHTLLQLNKKVYILCDTVNDGQIKPALEKSDAWRFNDRKLLDLLKYECFKDRNSWNDEEDERLRDIFAEANHIVNVGRPGPSEDGHFYSFDNRQMTHYQPHFERLFEMSAKSRGSDHHVPTTCIGELGNELGMGQLKNVVTENVPNGSSIYCTVKADFIIVATIVNFGAYGLCAMLAMVTVATAKKDESILLDDMFPNRQEQAAILKCLVDEASRCGVTGTRDQIIDKYPAQKVWEVMENIRNEARDLVARLCGEESTQSTSNKPIQASPVPTSALRGS